MDFVPRAGHQPDHLDDDVGAHAPFIYLPRLFLQPERLNYP